MCPRKMDPHMDLQGQPSILNYGCLSSHAKRHFRSFPVPSLLPSERGTRRVALGLPWLSLAATATTNPVSGTFQPLSTSNLSGTGSAPPSWATTCSSEQTAFSTLWGSGTAFKIEPSDDHIFTEPGVGIWLGEEGCRGTEGRGGLHRVIEGGTGVAA